VFAIVACGVGAAATADDAGRLLLDSALVREPDTRSALLLANRTETDLLRAFGGEKLVWGNNRFSIPMQQETWRLDPRRSLLINVLAIEWQHTLNASNLVTLGARRGDSLYSDAESPGSSGTAATLTWSSLFEGESRVTGRLFAGDEMAKERYNGSPDRRYYGLLVEGRYGLWRDHAPFASLEWQRRSADTQTGGTTTNTRFGAGWNWQVRPSWDVRAEANYRLVDDNTDTVEADHTQLYFSTRYGFR
jgi:hypothetical protein